MNHLGFARVGGLEKYLNAVEEFHGFRAPGLLIGGFMVDFASEDFSGEQLLNAVVETGHCLPDAVQLLTACTTGNGWVKIIDAGRFAITLYDKETLQGFRVFVDPSKFEKFPEIDKWFFRKVTKDEQPLEVLNPEILRAGREILSRQPVLISAEIAKKRHAPKAKKCSICNEYYREEHPDKCSICIEPYYS